MLNYRYNFFLLTRTVFLTIWFADWSGAQKRWGGLGSILEFFRAVVGVSSWPIFIEAKTGIGPSQVRDILKPYGIPLWAWGYSRGQFMMRVKKKHAVWAEYLLLSAGMPVTGVILNQGFDPAKPPRTKGMLPQGVGPVEKSRLGQQAKKSATASQSLPTHKSANPVDSAVRGINTSADKILKGLRL